jgi:hypothetical protein
MRAFTEDDLQRLGKLVAERRRAIGLGILNAANKAAISKDTWKRVELGLRVRDTSYTDVERALQWEAGSCVAVLEGGDPIPAEHAGRDRVQVTKLDPQDFESAFVSAMIVTKGDLTGNEIHELSQRVTEELKRRGVL